MSQQLISLGIILIFIGFVIVFVGALTSSQKSDSNTKVAVGGFIGFIPFGFGSDKDMTKLVMITSIVIAIAFVAIQFILRK